jgi:hypothetical protein
MANIFLAGSTGNDANDGSTRALAKATLQAAMTAAGAGGRVYASHITGETGASALTLTSPGTVINPTYIFSINFSTVTAETPVSADLAPGYVVATTGASNITAVAFAHCQGITFSAGDGANTASLTSTGTTFWSCKDCLFKLNNTSASSFIAFGVGGTSSGAVWDNCQIQFGATTQPLRPSAQLHWKNTPTAIAGSNVPSASLFSGAASGNVILEGLDLSLLVSVPICVSNMSILSGSSFHLENCKLGGSNVFGTSGGLPGARVGLASMQNCDSGDTNYKYYKWDYSGVERDETTIVRTGGASDGTTPWSKKIVSSANCKPWAPFSCQAIPVWNETVGSVTLTVYGIWGGGAVPNNNDVWMEVRYMDTSGNPISSTATTGLADLLATPVACDADTSTWGGSTTDFKMSTTITPVKKGLMYVTVKVGAASATVYIDPLVEIS